MPEARLPVIDLSDFIGGSAGDKIRIAARAIRACETSGFFYVSNYGFNPAVFDHARQVAFQFFRGDAEMKSRLHISNFPHHRGYVGNYDVAPDPSGGGDIREAFKVALDLGEDDPDYLAGVALYGPNVWPEELPEFRHVIYDLYLAFQKLSKTIFNLFATGLELPGDYFDSLIQKPASVMNVNYYPAADSKRPHLTSGIGAHSDYEAFAMLWQDEVGGLEIEFPEGKWKSVSPVDNTLVINIGDLMSHWTNGRFRATRHRVVNTSGRERISFACFGNTNYHAMIECIPSCCSKDRPAKYKPVKCGDYLMDAVRRTYAYI